MIYAARMAGTYMNWCREGTAIFRDTDTEYGQAVCVPLNPGIIGSYAMHAAGFADIARGNGTAGKSGQSAEEIKQSILLNTWLGIIDDTIDLPSSSREVDVTALFLDNCRAALLEYTDPEVVAGVAPEPLQLTCYGLSRYLYGRLNLNQQDTSSHELDLATTRLRDPILGQLTTTEPDQLIEIAQNIGGNCSDISVLPVGFVDGNSYPEMRYAAWHLGAMAEVLDHGSEVIEDIGNGTNTFATALIYRDGVSKKTVEEIREWREEIADENLREGKSVLDQRQQGIYKYIIWLQRLRYQIKRIKSPVTPRNIEAAISLASMQTKGKI